MLLPDDAADGLQLVLVPLVKLVLDLLDDVHGVGAVPVERPLQPLVYILLHVLREETHLAPVHHQELNLR